MNSKLIRSIGLFFAASAAAFAANATANAYAFRVRVAIADSTDIQKSARDEDVLQALGAPSRRSSGNVWIYYRQHAKETDAADQRGCTTLILTFTKHHVSDMKLVNAAAEKVIVACATAGKPVAYIPDEKGAIVARAP